MSRIKLKSLEIFSNGVRRLKDIKLEFAERLTIIAGHNGVGKSTILGLVASASGLTSAKIEKTKIEKKNFDAADSYDINKIIHFDPAEIDNNSLGSPWPRLVYVVEKSESGGGSEQEHWKFLRLTKRSGYKRLRSVPTTEKESPTQDDVSL